MCFDYYISHNELFVMPLQSGCCVIMVHPLNIDYGMECTQTLTLLGKEWVDNLCVMNSCVLCVVCCL